MSEIEVEVEEAAESADVVEGFEPKIVAFCCHYCAYTAADLAGSMRLQSPPNVRVVRLLCTGKTDPIFFLKAFEGGADGVFVAGCMEGDCHFLQGNYRAKKRVRYTKGLLEEAGIGGERLEFFNMSAGEGTKFAAAVKEMTTRIKGLGPSPINAPEGHLEKTIEKIEQTVEKP